MLKQMKELRVTREQARNAYITKHNAVNEQYQSELHYVQKNLDKMSMIALGILLGSVFVTVLMYELWKYWWAIMLIVLLGIASLIAYGVVGFLKYRYAKLNKQYNHDLAELDSLRIAAQDATHELVRLCLYELTVTDHKYLLKHAAHPNQLLNKLMKEYQDAINAFYQNKATVDDYLLYYEHWRRQR